MPFLPLNETGGDIYYLQTGEGPDVVLVHGLASNLAFWYAGTILPLRPHYRLTAYDLRGHGKSGMPLTGYTHHCMADDLFHLIQSLNLGPFHLISHSFGGLIALSFALRYPQHLRSLTLADVPFAILSSTWSTQWPMLLPHFEQAGIVLSEDEPYPEIRIMEELARRHLDYRSRHRSGAFSPTPYAFGKADKRTLKRWLELLDKTTAREDFCCRDISREELLKINVPTLVTYGMESKWKISRTDLRTYFPNPEVRYLEAAGHAHPWEKPGIFLKLWRAFLDSVEASPGLVLPYEGRERRKYIRHKIHTQIELQIGGAPGFHVEAIDMSLAGVLVISPRALKLGSTISLVTPHSVKNQHHTLEGCVVREATVPTGKDRAFGIHIPFEGRNREICAEWLEHMSGSPAPITPLSLVEK